MKLWGCCPWIPNSSFFLWVLLLLILLITGRFCDQKPGWRNSYGSGLASRSSHYHQGQVPNHKLYRRDKPEAEEPCEGVSDIFLVLDKSLAVGAVWSNIYQFAVDLINSLPNPQIRFCIITFSCKGNVILPLTSDREEIKKGLERLRNSMIAGEMQLDKGYHKVESQMEKSRAKGIQGSTLVYTLMTEPIMIDEQKRRIQSEANRIQKLGASIHTVGINIVNTQQIQELSDRPEDGFPLREGFRLLPTIIPELSARACPKFTSVDNVTICAKAPNNVVFRGHGFLYGKGNDRIICRYKLDDSTVIDESPLSVGKYSLTCPGPKLEQPEQQATVELSLNKGKTFLSNNIKITSKDCASTTPQPVPETATNENPPVSEQLTTTNTTTTSTSPITGEIVKIYVKNKHFIFVPIGLSLLLALLLLGCLWQLCCPPHVKKPPSVIQPGKKSRKMPPPPPPVNVYPTIIICCCACRGVYVSKDVEGNIIVRNGDHSCCHRKPLAWSRLRKKGRYSNFDFCRALCTQAPCSPEICRGPGQECLPIAYCSQCHPPSARCSTPPSRMLPYLLPPPQINRRTVFSLPPP